jgi:hypothetical protein
VRKREEDAADQQEQFRARRAQRKARLQATRRKREQYWMVQQPFNDMPGRPNCVLCSLAGLSDVDKLSTLVQQENLDVSDPSRRPTYVEIWRSMDELGLRDQNTPPRGQFPELHYQAERARTKVRRDLLNRNPVPGFPFRYQAKWFMQTSSANTFLVIFEYLNGTEFDAHALLAVRRDDGSITYLDLQMVPPTVHDDIDPGSTAVIAAPTSVDWRRNRQLRNAVENGVHQPLLVLSNAPAPSTPEDAFNVDDFFASDPEESPE